jgi:hypothetical protein
MDLWPIILPCSALAFVLAYVLGGNFLRRAQVAKALREQQSLPPDHPIQVHDCSPFLSLGSTRAALWAALHCRYYEIEFRGLTGSTESFVLRAVFLPFLPWLQRIDRDLFLNDRDVD